MDKIKVKKVTNKKNEKFPKLCLIETEDGKKFDCFDTLEEGKEYEGNIKPNTNPEYNSVFSLPKAQGKGGFAPANKHLQALTLAVQWGCANTGKIEKPIDTPELIRIADVFFNYISKV